MVPNTFNIRALFIALVITSSNLAFGQSKDLGETYVDAQGVMRWSKTKEEVTGFGVNYTVPFAHAYRQAKKMGIDPKKAIQEDVYQMKRLGFDLYRVHVWDTEISDSLGNILENENLDAFDFLIGELKKQGIRYVLTPIAYWGNGWPEPDEKTPGFSHRYSKGECLTDPACMMAQERYLANFVNHKNPYTGLTYGSDPDVLAIEISNEPHHRGEPEAVQSFVEKMVKAIKSTGCSKPIFYNITHGVNFMESYFKAGINGGTFQWYPTGLGYQGAIQGNVIPNVDKYQIPFDSIIKKYNGAKLVYEFDAADVARNHVYPVMARSFREAGIQIGTHFSYDPTFLAPFNTEYNTHYMNLHFTPQKALALMICGEIFRTIPRYAQLGNYPTNLKFGDITIDYQNDLAVFNSPEKFIYSNTNSLAPKNEQKLVQIAGYGNSSLVEYDGKGAYFLDKIEPGVWRLEVLQDALIVSNPYGRNSPDKIVGVVIDRNHTMKIKLKELQNGFTVMPINPGNELSPVVNGNTLSLKSGTYLLKADKAKRQSVQKLPFGNYDIGMFVAPNQKLQRTWLTHVAKTEIASNEPYQIDLQYVAKTQPEKIEVIWQIGWRREHFEMQSSDGYTYTVTIPADKVKEGFLSYYVMVHDGTGITTYPSELNKSVYDWDFYNFDNYRTKAVNSNYPIVLFDADDDVNVLMRPWRRGLQTVPTNLPKESEYQIKLESIFEVDNENPDAAPIYDYSFKHFIGDRLAAREKQLSEKKQLVVTAQSLDQKPHVLQLALVMNDGSSYGGAVSIVPNLSDYSLNLSELELVKTVILPRPYPSFLPYYFDVKNPSKFDLSKIEHLQISIGPGLSAEEQKATYEIGIRQIRLE